MGRAKDSRLCAVRNAKGHRLSVVAFRNTSWLRQSYFFPFFELFLAAFFGLFFLAFPFTYFTPSAET